MPLHDITPAGAFVNAMEANAQSMKRHRKPAATEKPASSRIKFLALALVAVLAQFAGLLAGRGA